MSEEMTLRVVFDFIVMIAVIFIAVAIVLGAKNVTPTQQLKEAFAAGDMHVYTKESIMNCYTTEENTLGTNRFIVNMQNVGFYYTGGSQGKTTDFIIVLDYQNKLTMAKKSQNPQDYSDAGVENNYVYNSESDSGSNIYFDLTGMSSSDTLDPKQILHITVWKNNDNVIRYVKERCSGLENAVECNSNRPSTEGEKCCLSDMIDQFAENYLGSGDFAININNIGESDNCIGVETICEEITDPSQCTDICYWTGVCAACSSQPHCSYYYKQEACDQCAYPKINCDWLLTSQGIFSNTGQCISTACAQYSTSQNLRDQCNNQDGCYLKGQTCMDCTSEDVFAYQTCADLSKEECTECYGEICMVENDRCVDREGELIDENEGQ